MTKQALSVDLKLPSTTTAVTDPLMAAEFQRIYNAINNLAYFIDAATGRTPLSYEQQTARSLSASTRLHLLDVMYARATTDIAAGSACYLRKVGDEYQATKALADSAGGVPYKFATCFCVQDGGIVSGEFGAFNLSGGIVPYIAGLAEGRVYYLSGATAGAITATAPSGGTTFVQPLGFALDSTVFYYCPRMPTL